MISFGKAVIVYWLGFFGAQTFGQAFSEHSINESCHGQHSHAVDMVLRLLSPVYPYTNPKSASFKVPQRQEKRNYSWRKEIKPKLSGKKWE